MPTWNYPWEEWDAAMAYLLLLPGQLPPGAHGFPAAEQWFAQQYRDPQEAAWKLVRTTRACSYLERHAGEFAEFEVRGLPKGSPSGSTISHHLVGALYRWFSAAPDHLLIYDVPVAKILALAREGAAR